MIIPTSAADSTFPAHARSLRVTLWKTSMQGGEARTFARAKGAFGIVLAQELERKVD